MNEDIDDDARETVGHAEESVEAAGEQAEEQIGALSEAIREQPLTALLIALGLGFLLGRLMR
jgi:ElaB/YqjD/DUF883 family membrane-anchored ribosome-binding protein